jgi:endonuclease V-like protein UPF0215 family
VKSGVRALGVAESYRGDTSTLAGVVVRADRTVDGLEFDTCTVGGTDVTPTICSLFERLDRDDIQYLFVAGIALAWYNIVDLDRLATETGLPVLSVSFEDSEGLTAAIESEFEDSEAQSRLETYHAQPERRAVDLNGDTVYCRSLGLDDAEATEALRAFTPEGGRPEPLRVARLAARGVEGFRETHL